MGDVVLDTPIPSDWVRLNFAEYRALVRSPDDGWEASVLAGLLDKPAPAAVSLDLRIREGFGFVMACQVVRGHYRHYANGRVIYVHPHVKGPDRLTVAPAGHDYDIKGV